MLPSWEKIFIAARIGGLLLILAFISAPARAEQMLRFGVTPWAPEPEMRKMFHPVIDYLQERLGIRIEIVIPNTYDELMKRTADGEVDIASFNAVTYIKARHAGLPIKYLATILRHYEGEKESRDYYEGFIIVKKDSPYKTIDDLRGKTFAFVDTDSASGYRIPVGLLGTTGRGTPKEFFKKFFFMGDQEKVPSAVYYGSVDGGAVSDNVYKKFTAKNKFGDAFRIIERISPLPSDAWTTGPRVPQELADKIKDVLLSINPQTTTSDGRKVLGALGFPASGWSWRGPEFYEQKAPLLLYESK